MCIRDRNIRIGSDEPVEDDEGGLVKLDLLDKEIIVRLKNLRLGRPTIKEANGAEHHATPMECRLRKLTYFSPVYLDFKIFRDDLPPSPGSEMGFQEESSVHIGNLPIMVRSARCNLTQTMQMRIDDSLLKHPLRIRRDTHNFYESTVRILLIPEVTSLSTGQREF